MDSMPTGKNKHYSMCVRVLLCKSSGHELHVMLWIGITQASKHTAQANSSDGHAQRDVGIIS